MWAKLGRPKAQGATFHGHSCHRGGHLSEVSPPPPCISYALREREWERERAGDELQIHWIPSHLGVQGNEEADALAEAGRLSHPDNDRPVAKRPRVESMWEDLGLEEMSSEVSSSQRSEFASATVSEAKDMESASTSSEGSEGGGSLSGFSTDVSTNPKRRRG